MRKALSGYGWPALVGILGAVLLIQLFPQWVGLPDSRVTVKQVAAGSAPRSQFSFANAVEIASPAVVNLYTSNISLVEGSGLENHDPGELGEFFSKDSAQAPQETNLGSAVLMSEQGYLLTNYHVIRQAEQIIVMLKDGRELLASVIGADPETDLAVLKVQDKNLPSIVLGQSDNVRIGDGVLAIGNPYGVGQTVTFGIVSGTGRHHLGLNTYEDFIQTDAAINPGNSGGALIDASGSLIGINTAVFSRNSGSQGIGFAIPSKLALEVMESIIEHGMAVRGWLGLEVQGLSSQKQQELNLGNRSGVVVSRVYEKGPAAKAGLAEGDVILSIDGLSAEDGRTSMNLVARMRPGKKIRIEAFKQGEIHWLEAEMGVRPPIKPKPTDAVRN